MRGWQLNPKSGKLYAVPGFQEQRGILSSCRALLESLQEGVHCVVTFHDDCQRVSVLGPILLVLLMSHGVPHVVRLKVTHDYISG